MSNVEFSVKREPSMHVIAYDPYSIGQPKTLFIDNAVLDVINNLIPDCRLKQTEPDIALAVTLSWLRTLDTSVFDSVQLQAIFYHKIAYYLSSHIKSGYRFPMSFIDEDVYPALTSLRASEAA